MHDVPRTSARTERTMAVSDSGTRRITSARVGHSDSRRSGSATGGSRSRRCLKPPLHGMVAASVSVTMSFRQDRVATVIERVVTTVPDIPVVQLPALDADGVRRRRDADRAREHLGSRSSARTTADARDARRSRRSGRDRRDGSRHGRRGLRRLAPRGPRRRRRREHDTCRPAPVTAVERGVLALLAKPSTERIAFRGARGLVLAVGSGGRAAILIRGLAPPGRPTTPGSSSLRRRALPIRAARFTGTERAVFLARAIGPARERRRLDDGRPVGRTAPAAQFAVVALRG